ncbi:MAG: YihY/virulence factor BrkB family protein [Chloroflexi bacterium]|nr:YihY/virulence factor BrkB family protein [Chloroflexota bacterium]
MARAASPTGQVTTRHPATIRQRLAAGLRRAGDAERRIFGRGGWPRIVRNALVSFVLQAGTRMAAALSYYALLAAGPLLVLTIALGSAVLGEQETRDIVALTLPRLLPVSAELPSQLVESVVRSSPPATGLALATGIFSMIGFARALTSSLNVTLNEIGGEPIRRTARIVPLLYLAVLGLLWGSWAFEVVGRVAEANAGDAVVPHPGLLLGRVTPLVLAIVHFSIILAIVPRAPLTLPEIVGPAAIGGMLWEAARNLFGWLVGTDSFYLQLFGPLGGAVALLGWIYLSSVILVLTGQIAWAYAMERRGRGHLARRLPRQAGLEERAQTPFEVENAVNEAQL